MSVVTNCKINLKIWFFFFACEKLGLCFPVAAIWKKRRPIHLAGCYITHFLDKARRFAWDFSPVSSLPLLRQTPFTICLTIAVTAEYPYQSPWRRVWWRVDNCAVLRNLYTDMISAKWWAHGHRFALLSPKITDVDEIYFESVYARSSPSDTVLFYRRQILR